MTPSKWQEHIRVRYPSTLPRTEEGPERREEIRTVIETHVPSAWKGGRLLTIGCGDGFELDILRERGYDVIGVTNDEGELAQACADVIEADMHDMPFGDGAFANAYSKEVLEHSPAPYILLRELNRVTKKGGGGLHFISLGMEKQRETYHFSCFPDWLWVDLFIKAGFEVKTIYDGHETEYGFLVEKVRELSEPFCPNDWSYHLREVFNAIPREKLCLRK